MSSLTATEKRYFETLLGMESGYVLHPTLNNSTFGELVRQAVKVDIHSRKYQTYGDSKAKKLRAFWELENDSVVANVLSELLDLYQAECDLSGQKVSEPVYGKCQKIIDRLNGKKAEPKTNTEENFLGQDIELPSLQKIPLEPLVLAIIEARLTETQRAMKAKAWLSVIFLCGSILEGVLLGVAQQKPEKFNKTKVCPKYKDGKLKQFHGWTLAQFIDAAYEIGLIKLDVKKYGHALRDFRNYIHPYQQMSSGFSPDEHTAKVSFQVLKAALASLSGER